MNQVYVTWASPELEQKLQHAQEADAFEEVRKITQLVEAGNRMWSSWVLNKGGSVGDLLGPKGCLAVPAHYLDELPALREQYSRELGAWVSVGVGVKLSEATKALEVSRLQNRPIVFYSEECDQVIAQAHQPKDALQEDIARATSLNKDEGIMAPDGPMPHQREHSQGQVIRKLVDEEGVSPEKTHAEQDFEDQFHQHAQNQEKEDHQKVVESTKNLADVKQTLAQALTVIKQNAPIMEQIKQASPDLYQSMIQLSQATVQLARELGPQPMAKSEDLHHFISKKNDTKKCQNCGQGIAHEKHYASPYYAERAEQKEAEKEHKAELEPHGDPPGKDSEGDIEAQENGDELEKDAAIPTPKLPSGTILNGKVKVTHGDTGKEGWVSVRSGMVRSQDSSGHPASALRPGTR